jgi:hypothetical protein
MAGTGDNTPYTAALAHATSTKAGTGDIAPDTAELNELEASTLLIAFSEKAAYCGPNAEARAAPPGTSLQALRLSRWLITAETQLKVLKQQIEVRTVPNPPHRGSKGCSYRMAQKALRAEEASLEAMIDSLRAQRRYYAAPPNGCMDMMYIHVACPVSDDDDST